MPTGKKRYAPWAYSQPSPIPALATSNLKKGSDDNLKKVSQFREKPDYETAKEFLAQGNFLWNAGIFMWSVETIVNAFKKYQRDQYALFEKGISAYNTAKETTFIQENYAKAEKHLH